MNEMQADMMIGTLFIIAGTLSFMLNTFQCVAPNWPGYSFYFAGCFWWIMGILMALTKR